jgi:hypothetical protein
LVNGRKDKTYRISSSSSVGLELLKTLARKTSTWTT